MSYQQFPPAGGAPIVQQAAAPFANAPQPGARKPGLIAVGVLLLAAGIVAGVVLFLASSSNYEEGVKNLARAPIGCTTTLEFDEAGTYYVYVETVGSIGDLRGDCPNADTDYDSSGDDLPDVEIAIVDDGGDELDLDRDDSQDYDTAGFVGQSVATVEIEEAGDYEITATSDEDEVVVAVGRTPKDDAASMKTMGIGALLAGVLLGGLLLLLGLRRGKPTPSVGSGGSMGLPPSGPPTGPVPMTLPPTAAVPAQPGYQSPSYQPPSYQPPPPPAPTPTQQPTIPMPSTPPAPPAPPSGGPSWPAPPST